MGYTYDARNLLLSIDYPGTAEDIAYTYDELGRKITEKKGAAGKITDTGSASVSYDSRNNRTALMDTNDTSKNAEYTWAQNNLLTSVTTHEGTSPKTVSYTYGADSLLESRVEGSSTDQFVWDASRAIPAMLSDGKYEYIYSKDRTPLAQVEILTGSVTYLHHDLTGSVTASTNENGGLVGTVDFSPYGVATGSLLSSFGYAGEWTDATTGYSYLKARWLDSKTGTFLSEDPIVQQTNNAFSYTQGNPITQIDPLGLFSIDWNEMGQRAKASFNMVGRNAGYISAGLGVTALIFAATPLGPVLGMGSLVFGAVGAAYDMSNCLGNDDSACNPGMILIDGIGVATGGVATAVGRAVANGAKVTPLLAKVAPDLDRISLYAGVLGADVSLAFSSSTLDKFKFYLDVLNTKVSKKGMC